MPSPLHRINLDHSERGFVGLLVPFVLTYIKNKNHTEKFNSVLEYAEIAVKFAEQYYDKYSGETKYKHAANWLSERAKQIGIVLSEDEVRGIIEATLKILKWNMRMLGKKRT
ncbi:phage holin, LLH family [Cytobacillus sp. Hm23]